MGWIKFRDIAMNGRRYAPPPEGLDLLEYFTAYRVLMRIREQVLSGRPSGRVIDEAMAELLDLAGKGGRGDGLVSFCRPRGLRYRSRRSHRNPR